MWTAKCSSPHWAHAQDNHNIQSALFHWQTKWSITLSLPSFVHLGLLCIQNIEAIKIYPISGLFKRKALYWHISTTPRLYKVIIHIYIYILLYYIYIWMYIYVYLCIFRSTFFFSNYTYVFMFLSPILVVNHLSHSRHHETRLMNWPSRFHSVSSCWATVGRRSTQGTPSSKCRSLNGDFNMENDGWWFGIWIIYG